MTCDVDEDCDEDGDGDDDMVEMEVGADNTIQIISVNDTIDNMGRLKAEYVVNTEGVEDDEDEEEDG